MILHGGIWEPLHIFMRLYIPLHIRNRHMPHAAVKVKFEVADGKRSKLLTAALRSLVWMRRQCLQHLFDLADCKESSLVSLIAPLNIRICVA